MTATKLQLATGFSMRVAGASPVRCRTSRVACFALAGFFLAFIPRSVPAQPSAPTTLDSPPKTLAAYQVRGVNLQLLKDYDPAGGKEPFYHEPKTDWKRLRSEDLVLAGARGRIIHPEKPAPGNPWMVDRAYGDPLQVGRALLEKGFYYVCMELDDFGTAQSVARWNALYAELAGKRGFSKKVVLEGYSRSGLGVYNWAIENPEKVACIYLDAPVLNIQSWPGGKGKGSGWPAGWAALQKAYGFASEAEAVAYDRNPVDRAAVMARANVPIIHVCGDKDTVVPYAENTGLFADRYEKAGGRNMTIILKGGMGHWTHGLKDPSPVVEFILQAVSGKATPGAQDFGSSPRPTETRRPLP